MSQARERSTIQCLGRTSHWGLMRTEMSTPSPGSLEISCSKVLRIQHSVKFCVSMRGGDIKQALKKFLVDGGYSGERFANQVKDICGAQVEVVKRSELHKFVVLPRRWVVERLFGWLDKFRRLWKNCERKLFISAQILNFALIAILIRRF